MTYWPSASLLKKSLQEQFQNSPDIDIIIMGGCFNEYSGDTGDHDHMGEP